MVITKPRSASRPVRTNAPTVASRPLMISMALPPGHFIHFMPNAQANASRPIMKSNEKKGVRWVFDGVMGMGVWSVEDGGT